MALTAAELIAAIPTMDDEAQAPASQPAAVLPESLWPAPTGRWRRLAALGTLQAKIAAGYLFYWLRGWFRGAEENQKSLAEAHWRSAAKLLDSMGYLRGAVMKCGQTLASFPDIAPREFVQTLEGLHYDAPPMHWSLLQELVQNELGDDPLRLFAEFERRAFAAASLGQVHRARLKTGEPAAVKIQYPGIARTIESDFRNLFLLLLPVRLGRDWENTRDQFEDLRRRLTQETDYVREARNLELARSLFREEEGIVVPRVFAGLSTARVLTMERLDGLHLDQFLAGNPSQAERDEIGRKISLAWYRLIHSGRMMYADFHPGNVLVLNDGRLGLLDFGFVMNIDDEQWEMFREIDRPLTTGRREDRLEALRKWNEVSEQDPDRLRVADEFCEWFWMGRHREAVVDFGDEADFRRGINLFGEMIRKRYTRGRADSPSFARSTFGWRALLFQLRARFDIRAIAEEEVPKAGWDRSDYAPSA